ncbi:nuclear transport factor 2 family protein [Fibrella aquatica]|uniref:nuclear transport factor 2 family protein n=1 Tax=Fibrella aquatica TaxID=3242487 RepID=UPI003520F870
MKKAILLLGTLMTASLTHAQTTPVTQEPQPLVSAFFKAMESEDAATVAALTTDDFAIVNFDGQIADRALLSQGLTAGILVVETSPATNLSTRTYNGNTAIVTGNSSFKGTLQGENFNADVVFTVSCVKMANGWKIAAAQLSGTGK